MRGQSGRIKVGTYHRQTSRAKAMFGVVGTLALILSLVAYFNGESRAQEGELKKFNRQSIESGFLNVFGELHLYFGGGERRHQFESQHQSEAPFPAMEQSLYTSWSSVKLISASKIELSQPFLRSLQQDRLAYSEYLDFARNKRRVSNKQWQTIIDVNEDLALKASFLSKANTDRVETEVRTIDSKGAPVSNCFIYYAPAANFNESAKIKFDSPSTPTTDFVPAGKWRMWAEKGGKSGAWEPYNCGADSAKKRTNTISAP